MSILKQILIGIAVAIGVGLLWKWWTSMSNGAASTTDDLGDGGAGGDFTVQKPSAGSSNVGDGYQGARATDQPGNVPSGKSHDIPSAPPPPKPAPGPGLAFPGRTSQISGDAPGLGPLPPARVTVPPATVATGFRAAPPAAAPSTAPVRLPAPTARTAPLPVAPPPRSPPRPGFQ